MKKARKGFIKTLPYLCLVGVIALGLMTIVGTGGGGGGGGGGGAPTITLNDLVGTYNLTAFTVAYDDGLTITQEDVDSYSGTMLIMPDGSMSQTVETNGFVVSFQGTILSVVTDTLRIFTPECTYDLGFELDGNVLTTFFLSGTCGVNWSEVDVWEKTSASTSLSKADNLAFEEAEKIEETIPGGAVGSIWNFLP